MRWRRIEIGRRLIRRLVLRAAATGSAATTVEGIIECKRLGSGRIASVKEVRALVGAALDFRVRSATLVITTDCSKEAIAYAGRISAQGLTVDLVAGVELLRRLEAFPLDLLVAESLAIGFDEPV